MDGPCRRLALAGGLYLRLLLPALVSYYGASQFLSGDKLRVPRRPSIPNAAIDPAGCATWVVIQSTVILHLKIHLKIHPKVYTRVQPKKDLSSIVMTILIHCQIFGNCLKWNRLSSRIFMVFITLRF